MLMNHWFEELKHHDIAAKELRLKMQKANLSVKVNVQDLRKRFKNVKPPIETKKNIKS